MSSQPKTLHSCVYKGQVRHRRFMPVSNAFTYDMFMLYLDLDEVAELFTSKWYTGLNRLNIASFKRADYFKASHPDLKQAVIDKVNQYAQEHGQSCLNIKRVRVLTHARYFNLIFNPVSFYYCFDDDEQLVAIMAEITNTPWGERHAYVLLVGTDTQDRVYQLKGDRHHVFQFDKQFHVSPFNPMNMQYNWVVSAPTEKLHIHMDNTQQQGEIIDKHFDATLTLEQYEWQTHFSKSLVQYPFMTLKVVLGIYWQALKLWIKKAPFYDHPDGDAKGSQASSVVADK